MDAQRLAADKCYYRQRIEDELDRAAASNNPVASEAHRELAHLYSLRVAILEEDRHTFPAPVALVR